MNRKVDVILGVAAVLVLGLLVEIDSGDLPLGIERQWMWPRFRLAWNWPGLLFASSAVVAYAVLAGAGYQALGRPGKTRRLEVVWISVLVVAAVLVQAVISLGAPEAYGVKKWVYIHGSRAASGYYHVAKNEAVGDLRGFLAAYPEWIARQGPDHLGTHPPGLIAMFAVFIRGMERVEGVAGLLNAAVPTQIALGFHELEAPPAEPISEAERGAIILVSLLTLFACAATTAPLYLLAREWLPSRDAWATAALWPLGAAVNLFLPLTDAAYPLCSATAIALACRSVRAFGETARRSWSGVGSAVGTGVVMAFGIVFTLALLPIGLIVGLAVLSTRGTPWRRRWEVIGWIGLGFLAITSLWRWGTAADPLTIWVWNLHHNADFYDHGPGAGRVYAAWVFLNPIELMIAAGLPVVVWGVAALIAAPRRIPVATWWTLAVLAIINLSGRSMAESARLWMIFLPPFYLAAGVGLARLEGGRQGLVFTAVLMGVQTLGLQSLIQCTFPP